MAVLSQMPRADMLKVINILEHYLLLADDVMKKEREVGSLIYNEREKVKKQIKTRKIILALLVIFTFHLLFFLIIMTFSVFSSEIELTAPIDYLIPILSGVGVIGLLSSYVIVFLIFKKKNRQDAINSGKYVAGICAYIPHYEKQFNQYMQKVDGLCAQYGIHKNLTHIDILRYVKTQFAHYPNMTLDRIVQDYYEQQDRQRIIDLSKQQIEITRQAEQERERFYDDVRQGMNRQEQLRREELEAVNAIRYYNNV